MRKNQLHLNRAHELRADQENKYYLRLRIAGINIELNCIYGNAFSSFSAYLSKFDIPDIRIAITHNDIDNERLLYPELKAAKDVAVDSERVAVTYDYGCLEPVIAFKKITDAVISFNTFLIHGSVVSNKNCAYMFTAPSGVGKSTRTKIWLEEYSDSIIVNGDKPFIRITEHEAIACGTPWCGKEGWNTNIMVPLKAVFLLERAAEGEESSIEQITIGKAFPDLLQQTHQPDDPNAMRKTIQLLMAMGEKVKLYRFRSTPTPEAIRLAYETTRYL